MSVLLFFVGWLVVSCIVTPIIKAINNPTAGFLVYATFLLLVMPYELIRRLNT